MAISSRVPLEFIAVVGVLIVTVAIIEVPRSNMRPPEASHLDAETWRVPPESATSSTLLPLDQPSAWTDSELAFGAQEDTTHFEPSPAANRRTRQLDLRRIERLEVAIDRKCEWLTQRRADLAMAELELLTAKASVAPRERALLAAMALPQETLPEILERRERLATDSRAVVSWTHAVNRSRYRVKELARSVARRQVKVNKMQEELERLHSGLTQSVALVD